MHILVAPLAIAALSLFADGPAKSTAPVTATPGGAVARENKIGADSRSAAAAPRAVAPSAAKTQKPAATAQQPLAQKKPAARVDAPLSKRVLFITSTDSAHSAEELSRLRRPGGDFEQMRTRGWKIGAGPENHLQVVDRETVPELVSQLNVREYPAVAFIDNGEIVRSFREGCTTPLDMWTFGWLSKGIDERPPGAVSEAARVETTGKFPLRGNHWSIDGDSTPSREKVISHLHGGFHGSQLAADWDIETWSYEELRSLHDHLHERYGGGAVRSSRSGSANRGSSQFSASRKTLGH